MGTGRAAFWFTLALMGDPLEFQPTGGTPVRPLLDTDVSLVLGGRDPSPGVLELLAAKRLTALLP